MTKSLRIVDAVAEHDIPAIVDYHRLRSKAKAERIVAEYDRIIELLAINPHVLAERSHGWRVYSISGGHVSALLPRIRKALARCRRFPCPPRSRLDSLAGVDSRSGGVDGKAVIFGQRSTFNAQR